MQLRPAIEHALAVLPIRQTSLAISVILGLSVTLGGAWIAVWPESWLVERVIFEGNHRSSEPSLRHLADLPNGTTVWQLDPERIALSVERHPWVHRANVAISWPDTVRITVEEHTPAAILHTEGHLVYVDEEGEPFLPAQPDDLDYPHLIGFEPELSKLHPELGVLAIRDTLWLIDALVSRNLLEDRQISTVRFSRTAGLEIDTGASRLLFGFDDLPGQIDRLVLLVESGTRLDAPVQIDLAPATVAIVRTLPDRSPTPQGG